MTLEITKSTQTCTQTSISPASDTPTPDPTFFTEIPGAHHKIIIRIKCQRHQKAFETSFEMIIMKISATNLYIFIGRIRTPQNIEARQRQQSQLSVYEPLADHFRTSGEHNCPM
ncbi:hypothetical protein J6590_067995 [Homalodisca vitripennis]|nr:hypothetical protein J6590_067995 [Homalodisca vitripennis]